MIDMIWNDARILTVDRSRPRARRVGIHGGRIVGVDEELSGLRAKREIDLQGAVVVPGFNDVHAHSVWFGLTASELDLAGARSAEDVHRLLASVERADGDWIIGAGLDHLNMSTPPARAGLDAVADSHPVFLKTVSGHSGYVNSRALQAIERRHGTAALQDSGLVRDANGEPTGLIEENALRLVQSLFLPYSLGRIEDALERATSQYSTEGITSVTDAGIAGGWIGSSPVEFAAYQNAADAGRLHTRMSPMLTIDALNHRDGDLRTLQAGIRTGLGDDRLRIGPTKIFTDGSLLGSTAAMSEPYCGTDHGHQGYLLDDPAVLRRSALAAAAAGWSLALHAIGDVAVELAVSILEEAQRAQGEPRRPHRIEHGGVVASGHLRRIAAAGIVLVPQPHFIHQFGDGMRELLGEERVDRSYPARSILDAGAILPGSSDRPVADGRPLRVMQSFVERLTASGKAYAPSERITAEEALRAYTRGSAEATGTADRLGQIRSGLLADLAVLADDPTEVSPSRIGDIDVLATALGGAATHDPSHILG